MSKLVQIFRGQISKSCPLGKTLKIQYPVLSQIGKEHFSGNVLPGSFNDYFNLFKYNNGTISE